MRRVRICQVTELALALVRTKTMGKSRGWTSDASAWFCTSGDRPRPAVPPRPFRPEDKRLRRCLTPADFQHRSRLPAALLCNRVVRLSLGPPPPRGLGESARTHRPPFALHSRIRGSLRPAPWQRPVAPCC